MVFSILKVKLGSKDYLIRTTNETLLNTAVLTPIMKVAAISDIHSNIFALQAAIRDAKLQGADKFLCLGDIVGYASRPREVLAEIRGITSDVVLGNHDLYCSITEDELKDSLKSDKLHSDAAKGIKINRLLLNHEELSFLGTLKDTIEENPYYQATHSSMENPLRFNYIHDNEEAMISLKLIKQRVLFVGHSHIPSAFMLTDGTDNCNQLNFSHEIYLYPQEGRRYLINPGSVGQPRDEDSRAAYAIYDTDKQKVTFRKVAYDVEKMQKDIRERRINGESFPFMTAYRLEFGR
jgi:predicted phosphodiesterase